MGTPFKLRNGLFGIALLGCMAGAQAQPSAPLELKALVVVKALLFVNWPPTQLAADQPVQVCVMAESGFGRALLGLPAQQVNQRPLRVRQVNAGALSGCHVLVVAPGLDWSGAPSSALVVSDAPGMLQRGVMLNLQVENGRVVFDIGLDEARRAGLDISTKLLRLARFVRRDGDAG